MPPFRALFAAAALAAAASACSDDAPTSSAQPAPSETPAASTSTTVRVATTTTEPKGPPPDPGGGPCADPGPPPAGEELGRADVDGDGQDERWVRTGSGASTLLVGLYSYDEDCSPTRVRLDGAPAELGVGGSITHLSGVRCTGTSDVHLHVYAASSDDGRRYEVLDRSLRLAGDQLVEVDRRVVQADATDPGFPRYATFACGEIQL